MNVEEDTEFTIHLMKLEPVIYLCTITGWLTLDSEYHVLPLFTSVFDANINRHQPSQSQSAIYTFKQMNFLSLISSKEMCKNHTHPVWKIVQWTKPISFFKWSKQCTTLLLVFQNSVIWWQHNNLSAWTSNIKLCNIYTLINIGDTILKCTMWMKS